MTTYYPKCSQNYLDFLTSLASYSIAICVFFIFVIFGYIYLNRKYSLHSESLEVEYFPLHPILYILLISISKTSIYIFTKTVESFPWIWLIVGIIAIFFLSYNILHDSLKPKTASKRFGSVNLRKINIPAILFIIIYTFSVINWREISPYIVDFLSINQCVMNELFTRSL